MGRRRDWQDTDLSRAWRTFLMGPRPPSVRWPRSWEQRGRSSSAVQSHSRTRPQQSGPKTRQSKARATRRPSKATGASISKQSGRPCCRGTSTSDSSAGSRGFAWRGQPRRGQSEDHTRGSQGPDPSCPSRRTIGCMLEVHRACEKASREWLSGCRVKPRRPHQTGPPGLAHDSPRTPNVHT